MLRRFIVFLLPIVGLMGGCAEQKASQPDPKLVSEVRELKRQYEEREAAMRPIEAVVLLEQAIALLEVHFGANDPKLADLWYALGRGYRTMASYEKSMEALRKALEILEAKGFQRSMARGEALLEHARVLSDLGRDQEAIASATEAVAVLKLASGETSREVMRGLYHLSRIHMAAGRDATAIEILSDSLRVIQRTNGAESDEFVRTLHSLAEVHAQAKQLARARELHMQALALRQRALGDHKHTASSLGRVALFEMECGNHEQALSLAQQAVAILAPEGPSKALAVELTTLGAAQAALGLTESMATLENAREAIEAKHGHGASAVIAVLTGQAQAAAKLGADELSNERFNEAFAVTTQALGASSLQAAEIRLCQAEARIERADARGARKALDEVASLHANRLVPISQKKQRQALETALLRKPPPQDQSSSIR